MKGSEESSATNEGQELLGQLVLLTRQRADSSRLAAMLIARGAEIAAVPTIGISSPVEIAPLHAALDELAHYQWVVFTSANGVRAVAGAIRDRTWPRLPWVAGVGPATQGALADLGLRCDLVPEPPAVECLSAALMRVCKPGDRVLYPRAERLRYDLAGALRRSGIACDDPVAYRNIAPSAARVEIESLLTARRIDWIVVYSGSALSNLLGLLGSPDRLAGVRLATLGPKTTAAALELGCAVAAEASRPTDEAVIASLIAAHTK